MLILGPGIVAVVSRRALDQDKYLIKICTVSHLALHLEYVWRLALV